MRTLSRWMPAAPEPKTSHAGWLFLSLLLAGLLFLLWRYPYVTLYIYGLFIVAFSFESFRYARFLRHLAADRAGDNICTFARSFDFRRTDRRILRAVYEELSRLVGGEHPLPIRADDRWSEDLRIDPEDFDDLGEDIAHRTGRSLENMEKNPYYRDLKTVRDLVNFFSHQPLKISGDVIA